MAFRPRLPTGLALSNSPYNFLEDIFLLSMSKLSHLLTVKIGKRFRLATYQPIVLKYKRIEVGSVQPDHGVVSGAFIDRQ